MRYLESARGQAVATTRRQSWGQERRDNTRGHVVGFSACCIYVSQVQLTVRLVSIRLVGSNIKQVTTASSASLRFTSNCIELKIKLGFLLLTVPDRRQGPGFFTEQVFGIRFWKSCTEDGHQVQSSKQLHGIHSLLVAVVRSTSGGPLNPCCYITPERRHSKPFGQKQKPKKQKQGSHLPTNSFGVSVMPQDPLHSPALPYRSYSDNFIDCIGQLSEFCGVQSIIEIFAAARFCNETTPLTPTEAFLEFDDASPKSSI
ncbi:unnamed protein product [Fusarium graminearum]|nr:unnamed protein product [Fusarium graminearum]CAG1967859.1 unnamed protein product [Fusarium graminearum]VTO86444.1 unnamed protein product [Fusarium graminearum]